MALLVLHSISFLNKISLYRYAMFCLLVHQFFVRYLCCYVGFPGGLEGKVSACNAGDTRDTVQSPGWEDPLE